MIRKYEQSSARSEFLLSVTELKTVLKKIAPPKKPDPDIKNYMYCSTILFLNAKLENYISDLFEGVVQEFCRHETCPSKIPNSLLGWVFLKDGNEELSKRFISKNDEGEYIAKTGNYLNQLIAVEHSKYITNERFRGISDKSYPSVKNLKLMYKRFGVTSVFDRLNRRLKRDVELELESLNAMRGSLAHSGISGALTYQEVKNKIRSVENIVRALDQVTFYHLRDEECEFAWKST